jgi:hypothetical protein
VPVRYTATWSSIRADVAARYLLKQELKYIQDLWRSPAAAGLRGVAAPTHLLVSSCLLPS